MSHVLEGTRLRLAMWARWARGGIQGFPSCSAFMHNGSRETSDGKDLDPYIEEVDTAVRQSDPPDRRIIVVAYTQSGTRGEQAARLHLPRGTFYRKLEHAEWGIHVALDSVDKRVQFSLKVGVPTPQAP